MFSDIFIPEYGMTCYMQRKKRRKYRKVSKNLDEKSESEVKGMITKSTEDSR